MNDLLRRICIQHTRNKYGLTGMTLYVSVNIQYKLQVAEIFLAFKSKETIKGFKIPLSLRESGYQSAFLLFRTDGTSYFFPEILNFASRAILQFNWGKKGLKYAKPIKCWRVPPCALHGI